MLTIGCVFLQMLVVTVKIRIVVSNNYWARTVGLALFWVFHVEENSESSQTTEQGTEVVPTRRWKQRAHSHQEAELGLTSRLQSDTETRLPVFVSKFTFHCENVCVQACEHASWVCPSSTCVNLFICATHSLFSANTLNIISCGLVISFTDSLSSRCS